jgi:hypothetical protein
MSLRHAILLLALSGCGSDKQPAYTIETLPGGVVHVVNHGPSGWADTLGWKIVLEDERTIPADSVGALLRPNYPHQLTNGDVVVLNQGPLFVQRYRADFTPFAQFGREGTGPGEFKDGSFRTIGDSIVMLESSRSTLILFDADGTYLAEDLIPTFTDWIGPRDSRGRVALLGRYAPSSAAGVMWWSLAERRVVDSIIGPAGPEMRMWESCAFVIPYQPSLELVPTLDGNAWWGVRDADRFILTRTGSDTLRIVETPDRPRYPVPSQRIDEDLDPERGIGKFCRDMKRSDFPTTLPAWNGLEIDGEGTLWVRRPSGFDVYDPDGRWLGEVPPAYNTDDGWPYWSGDVILTAKPEDDGGMTLRRYRIRREK